MADNIRKFKRGARATKRHKLAASMPFRPVHAAPPFVAYVPKQLSMWLNDTDGDCVTAEEAFNKACNATEIFIQDATVQAWATQYGFLNGADLTDVMDQMAKAGFQQDSDTYGDGAYTAVDYSTESVLQAALAIAPVKIGIDADALPSTAGNQQGWVATGGTPQQFTNEDHCVALAGYGTAQQLFQALGVALPSTLQPTQTGYLLYTWSTIGFVDHAWIMSTCGEAWLRNPTTTVNGQPQPNPGPVNPPPTPTPPTPPTPIPPVPPAPPVPPTPVPPAPTAWTVTDQCGNVWSLPASYTISGGTSGLQSQFAIDCASGMLQHPTLTAYCQSAGCDTQRQEALSLLSTAKARWAKFSLGTIVAIITASMKIFTDFASGNLAAIPADITALIAAFGS